MIELRIRDVGQEDWVRAQKVARQFLDEYPENFGFLNGVVYFAQSTSLPALYAYRTKTAVVVRGEVE